MSEKEKGEEETYSLIFTSLKHPIRRKILRMLTDSEMTFSQILETLSIDSGHLSYHIENLGELVSRSSGGKYKLSSVGVAAVRLMSGVEEQPKFATQKTRETLFGNVTRVYALFFAIALIVASLYFVNFTTVECPSSITVGRGTPKTIFPSQSYSYNITMVYKEASLHVSNFTLFDPVSRHYVTTVYKEPEIDRSEENGFYMERYPPANTITYWIRCHFFFGLETNDTYDLSLRIYSPDGKIIGEERQRGAPGHIEGVGHGEITQEGTYHVEFFNINSTQISAFIKVRILWERFQKPYYYLGLITLIATLSYPAFLLLNQLTKLRRKNKNQISSLAKPL